MYKGDVGKQMVIKSKTHNLRKVKYIITHTYLST